MTRAVEIWVLFCSIAISGISALAQDQSTEQPEANGPAKRPYTICKETTYFTGPLKPDGSVDFIAAVNEHFAIGVTPENNAATIIVPLMEPDGWYQEGQRDRVLQALGLNPLDCPPDQAIPSYESFAKDSDSLNDTFRRQFNMAHEEIWSDDRLPLVAEWLAQHKAQIDHCAAGAKRSHFYVPLVSEKPDGGLHSAMLSVPHRRLYRLGSLFSIRARNHMANNRWDDAWADIETNLRLARHTGNCPVFFLIDRAFTIANQASRDAIAFIERAHAAEINWRERLQSWDTAPFARVREALDIGDRLWCISAIQNNLTDPTFIRHCPGDYRIGLPFTWIKFLENHFIEQLRTGTIDMDTCLRHVSRHLDELVAALDIPDPSKKRQTLIEAASKVNDVDAFDQKATLLKVALVEPELRPKEFAQVMIDVESSNRIVASIVHRYELSQASRYVVKTALAVKVYQSKTGRLPTSLNELKEFVDESILIQPPTGEPIGFRCDKYGIVIYHWGDDDTDNGGDIEPYDVHIPSDWGIRIKP